MQNKPYEPAGSEYTYRAMKAKQNRAGQKPAGFENA